MIGINVARERWNEQLLVHRTKLATQTYRLGRRVRIDAEASDQSMRDLLALVFALLILNALLTQLLVLSLELEIVLVVLLALDYRVCR